MNNASQGSETGSADYFPDDNSQFLAALATAVLPGDELYEATKNVPQSPQDQEWDNFEPLLPNQQTLKRKRSDSPTSAWTLPATTNITGQPDDTDDTYHPSKFGGWGDYMRRKRAKLQVQNAKIQQREASGSQSKLFQGLAIYINGHTRPSVQELRELIVKHGGVFHPYLVKKAMVTHIVTCSLTPAKVKEFKHMKVARPEWLTESVAEGVLLDWEDYRYDHDQPTQTQSFDTSLSIEPSARKAPPPLAKDPITTLLKSKPPPPVEPLYVTDPATKKDAARVPGYAVDASNAAARRVMANPEWRKAHTSASSDFIDGYYKNSRLHHLSRWKLELKELVKEAQERAEAAPSDGHVGKVDSDLQDGGVTMRGAGLVMRSPSSKWKGKGKAVEGEDRVIMHCDFDSFFVSAGLVSRPELKGKPVIVCHSQGAQGGASSTSEIASSSYEARKFGIKNGMRQVNLLQQARQLCPDVITIPYEFERYKQFSLLFYTVLMQHADDLQAVSVDEALIDVSTTVNQMKEHAHADPSYDPAKVYAEKIRAEIRKLTNCEVSIGISHNILLARLATRRAKPGGSYHLLPAELDSFLDPLEISDLHGFGYHTKQKAQEKLGAINLGDLRKKNKSVLIGALGKSTGETLYNALRGIDHKQLESDKPRKSVSCDITYGIRFESNDEAEAFVRQMATEVKKRLDAIGMVGRSITLKIMKRDPTAPVEPAKFLGHGPCDLFNKQMPLSAPGGRATADEQVIGDHAWRLLKSFRFDPKELRGIGIQIQKLESASTAGKPAQGQAMLDFKSTAAATTSGAKFASDRPGTSAQTRQLSRAPSIEPTKAKTTASETTATDFDLPSFSQVDKSVLEALPDDVRRELESEYKRRDNLAKGVGPPPATAASPGPGRLSPTHSIGAPDRQTSILPAGADRFGRRSATPSIFPPKPQGKPNYSAIAQRLAPSRRGGTGELGGATSGRGAYGRSNSRFDTGAMHAWALRHQAQKASSPPRVKISVSKLQSLSLDPDVFFALPIEVQREQLIMARVKKANKGVLPEVTEERKVLKRKKLKLPEGYVVWKPPLPKARVIVMPALRRTLRKGEKLEDVLNKGKGKEREKVVEVFRPQRIGRIGGGKGREEEKRKDEGKGKGKKEKEEDKPDLNSLEPTFENGKLCFRSTSDIQSMLTTWIEAYRHWPPRPKDVEYVAHYLVQAIDGNSFTDESVARAIEVMRWWLFLARRFWPEYETIHGGYRCGYGEEPEDEDEDGRWCLREPKVRDDVAQGWWGAFYDVKERMDKVARVRFGGKLALR